MIFMLKLNMGWNYLSSMLFFFFLFMGLSVSSTFISDDIFETHAFTGRNLLQAKKACPVNFEFMNYTIITSQCKGPKYPPDKCCPAFKQFACPYAEEISDLSTDCASTMFSYINIYGKYPAGIFASECQEGKEGLSCPQSPLSKSEDAKASQTSHTTSPLIMLTTGFLGLLLMLL